jgi:polyhydroxyalkanoate synthesis regulator phasin
METTIAIRERIQGTYQGMVKSTRRRIAAWKRQAGDRVESLRKRLDMATRDDLARLGDRVDDLGKRVDRLAKKAAQRIETATKR